MNITSCNQKIRRNPHLGLVNLDRFNIRMGAKIKMWEYILDSAGSLYSKLSGCCAHRNKVHYFIKIREYMDQEMNCHLLKYALFNEPERLLPHSQEPSPSPYAQHKKAAEYKGTQPYSAPNFIQNNVI